MKRILISLLSIGVVSTLAIGASQAWFSDTEQSTNNKITAGDINLEVTTGAALAFEPVQIDDMKPSYVRWTKHTVTNSGTNPLRLWKRIKDIATSENTKSDAEREWYSTHPNELDGNGQKNDIDKYIEYDMYVGGEVDGDPAKNYLGGKHDEGGRVVIDETDGITLYDIQGVYVYLGELQPEESMVVWQSYHMKNETGNWAQTDRINFTIEFYGEQDNGDGPIGGGIGQQTLLLENKDTNWDPEIGDGTWGVLKWAGDGPTFDFSSTLKAHGLTPNTAYDLIYAPDVWPQGIPFGVNNIKTVLGTGTSDANGYLEISENPDLGFDIPHVDDANYPLGGKIWLVLASDHDDKKMTGWHPTEYLFEYNLITYDDTNI